MRAASWRARVETTGMCASWRANLWRVARPWDNRPAPTKGAFMESSSPTRVLVVANKTAATPALIAAVRERAAHGPAAFTLVVPNPTPGLHRVVDPEDVDQSDGEHVLELAIPLLEEAAGGKVEGL